MSTSRESRRSFLKTTATAAAAGVTVPYLFTSHSAADDVVAANDKLNVGVIGSGGRGSWVGHQAGAIGNMVAVADVDTDNAKKFAERYDGKCEIYDDYKKILDRKDIDVIVCGTPDHWHAKIGTDAMLAEKDVYCEKPLTLTIDESKQIRAMTTKTGRIFQVGTQQRSEYDKMFLKTVAIARSGRLGDKLHALSSVGESVSGGPFPNVPVPKKLNFDFWTGPSPQVDFVQQRVGGSFRWWLEYSGGQITDWGVHHTDIAIWALGAEDNGVVEAEGKGEFPGLPEGVDVLAFLNGETKIPAAYNVAKTFNVKMKTDNGNTIRLTSGKNELIIGGSKGKIRVNRGGLSGKLIEAIAKSKDDTQWLEEEVAKLYRGMRQKGHMQNFFDCVKSREMPISDVWTHTTSVNACHIANIAMMVQRKVRFNPETYRFEGDEQANEFLSRKQRAPYQVTA